MAWVRQVQFTQMAREATMLDYLHEVDHMGERVKRLEQAITEAVKLATPAVQEGGQGLTGFARHRGDFGGDDHSGVRQHHRFGYAAAVDGIQRCGAQRRSSGKRTRRGSITKQGNAHLRRIVVELPGVIGIGQPSGPTAQATRGSVGTHQGGRLERTGAAHETLCPAGRRRARTRGRSSPLWDANCWASSGPSGSRRKRQSRSRWRPDKVQEQKQRQKQKLSKE